MQVAIVSSPTIHCHQLEAPELNIREPNTPFIPTETQASTCQIPFGEFSALSTLRVGDMKSIDTLLLSVLQYRGNWQSGKSWYHSTRKLAGLLGISIRYVRERLAALIADSWLSCFVSNNKGSRYELMHHRCLSSDVPTDKNGYPLMFAVPQGEGSPFERLFAGDISWKACLIWLVLKFNSDWKTGITGEITTATLAKWLRMGQKTICDCLAALRDAGLLKRLSKPHEAGRYQLYPKPDAKPKPVTRREKQQSEAVEGAREMRFDGEWFYSFNELYRLNATTSRIEKRERPGRGRFKGISDYHYAQEMPRAIKRDFELSLKIRSELVEALAASSSDSS